jgi:acyl-coenzyme A synthetase/AMP-(fatty) acid ligase
VLFEGIPTYPDAARCWQIIQKYKVTQFYTGMPRVCQSALVSIAH